MTDKIDIFCRARCLAHIAHIDQVDKSGENYYTHLVRVSEKVKDLEEKTVAYLHDILEDTQVDVVHLEAFGFPSHIIEAVKIVTQRVGEETYRKYIQRVKDSGNTLALAVKIADNEDHLDRKEYIPIGMIKRYERARDVLLGD